jgi:hypothetical protein
MAVTETAEKSSWAESKTAWKRRTVHNVTLETGMQVRIKFPDAGELIRQDALPDELIHIAFMDQFAPDKLREIIGDAKEEADLLKNFNELGDRLAVEMLVDPKLTLDELRQIPQEDLDMLKQIAMRERDTDARGVKLGVVRLDVFATFREAHERSADVAADHPPFPDPDCASCRDAFREFSSLSELLL